MALTLSIGCRNGLANTQGFSEMFDGGTLRIFSGDSPGVEYGVTGAELVSLSVAFSSAGEGVAALQQQSVLVSETGTAGYFRLSDASDEYGANANGTAVRADGTCGVLDISSDLTLVSLAMTAGVLFTAYGNFNVPT